MQAARLEAIKASLLKSLGMLNGLRAGLSENRSGGDADYQRCVQQLISQLTDTEQAVDALLKEAAAGALVAPAHPHPQPTLPREVAAAPASPPQHGVGRAAGPCAQAGRGMQQAAAGQVDMDFIAEAMADELRERLRQLARQVAELQSTVIQKDAVIQQLMDKKGSLEQQFGKPNKDRLAGYVPKSDYDELCVESSSLKEQLVSCLEELSAREREATDLAASNARYQNRLQTYADQAKMLYREYAVALSTWKGEKLMLERKVKKVQEDADAYKAASAEHERGLAALSRSNLYDLQREHMDTVRRMAVVQIKHAKIARELEGCQMSERALAERVEVLEQEVRDVSATCRQRMRWLEQAADASKRRVDALFHELQASAPLAAYRQLCEKHARQQGELRRLVEAAAGDVVGAEELLRQRQEAAAWMTKYDTLSDQYVTLKEQTRQLELLVKDRELAGPPGAPPLPGLDMALAQELVACRVAADSAARRVQLMEAERGRLQRTLEEAQARLQEVDERLAGSASEVEMLRTTRAAMEQRLQGAKTKQEVDDLLQRLDAAEAQAAEKHHEYANLQHRAQEAERKLEQANRDRQLHLAQMAQLRAALRDLAGHRGDQAASVARLHAQLDHALAKEALARNALNRSEVLRFQAEQELRKLQADLSLTSGRAALHQDHARWMDRQRLEAQSQLDTVMAGRTEAWKAKVWANKLKQLKARNDTMASALELARKRVHRLEEAHEAAQLKEQHKEDVAALLHKGVSEVVRDAARLHEQVLQLRLQRGQLQREDMLLKEKVAYVERVNAELHELLEKYEVEFFQQQSLLEGDKVHAVAQAHALQDEVVRLQERLAGALAGKDTDTCDQPRKLALNAAANPLRVSNGDVGTRLKAHLAAAGAGDREVMLKQIDSLRVARQEAEHLRQECARMKDELTAQGHELSDVRRHHNDALVRLQQQSEALLYALNHKGGAADQTLVEQMRAVAEATIQELQERLREREKAHAALEALMAAEKARWLAQHQADRAEVERLSQALFKYNNDSINNMKEALSRIPGGAGGGSGGSAEEVGHLRSTLGATTGELEALRARCQEAEAAALAQEKKHAAEARRLCAEVDRLNQLVDTTRQQQQQGPTRQQLDKLEAALRQKDGKLRQLRDAFKALEEKLIDAHKKLTDEHMRHAADLGAARKVSSDCDKAAKELQDANTQLEADLRRTRQELLALQQTGLVGGGQEETVLAALRQQVAAEQERGTRLEKELHRARAELQKYRNAERSVMDLTTGMSVEAKRQVDDAQKRVRVLEQQNAQLKRALQAHDESLATLAEAQPDNHQAAADRGLAANSRNADAPGHGRAAAGGAAGAQTAATGSAALQQQQQQQDQEGDVARTAAALAQWEEGKRLNRKIEELRKKVANKQEEVVAAKAAAEQLAVQLAAAQREVGQQATVIKTMQEKLAQAQQAQPSRAAAATGVGDPAKLQAYFEKLTAAEVEVDGLKAELARMQAAGGGAPTGSQQASSAGRSAAAGSVADGAGRDPLLRDAQLFEAQLQRDQAQAQVRRLQERMTDLFGAAAASASALPAATRASSGSGAVGGRNRSSSSSGGGGGAAAAAGGGVGQVPSRPGGGIPANARAGAVGSREAQLLSTIANLKSALEKATTNTTPTTKYMAEVQRRKDAQQQAATAQREVGTLTSQAASLQRLVAELQAQVSDLRSQLHMAHERGSSSSAAAGAAAAAGPASPQFAALESLLAQRDAELRRLQGVLADKEQQLVTAGGSASEVSRLRVELSRLQTQLAELQEENKDLKAELNAFDPQFFDEIEDLKHEHYVLSGKVEEYEGIITQLSARLGQSPPPGLPFRLQH